MAHDGYFFFSSCIILQQTQKNGISLQRKKHFFNKNIENIKVNKV